MPIKTIGSYFLRARAKGFQAQTISVIVSPNDGVEVAMLLDTLEGKKVASADFGKNVATVLNFVAPNCGYCKKQLPTVEKIREEYEKKGVRFLKPTGFAPL